MSSPSMVRRVAAALSLVALGVTGAAPAIADVALAPSAVAGSVPGGSGSDGGGNAVPDPAGASAATPAADVPAGGPTKEVQYSGVTVDVPAQMPVVNLDDNPATCVRYDRAVVYVGTPSAEQSCPARAVGRSSAVWIGPETGEAASEVEGAVPTQEAGTTRVDDTSSVERRRTVVLPEHDVAVRTTWRNDSTAMDDVAASVALDTAASLPSPSMAVTPSGAAANGRVGAHRAALAATQARTIAAVAPQLQSAVVPAAAAPAVAAAAPAVQPAAAPAVQPAAAPAVQPALTQAVSGSPGVFTGMAFDACSAPSVGTMQAWRASPYSAIGIYIGGALRACGDGNLSASWVDQVSAQGWGFIPIYVGLQAPCVGANLSTFSRDLTTAGTQGRAAGQDAVSNAQRFGLGSGSTLYFDMEAYGMSDSGCSAAAVAFIQSWTVALHDAGYRSGVYGGVGSMMRDLTRAVQAGGYTAPDAVWLAHWNDLQTTSDTMSPQYVPDSLWADHQRIRQYKGDHSETWGGVGLNIDSNWADAELPGNPTPTAYGQNITGPGGRGFVFTGAMTYWRAAPGSGAQGKAFWTRPSGTSAESNGATWQTSLAAGTYAVDANIPSTSGAGVARYTLTGGGSSAVATLDQTRGTGWQEIGLMTVGSDGVATVHLGDNGTTDTTRTLWADAVRWRLVSGGGTTPTPTGWTRIAGQDLYDTSAAIAQAGFASSAEAFVATGQDYPDAASGGAAAGLRRAPMLLTRGSDLPPVIADQLRRLRPTTTYVLGGPLAVSDAVVGQITAATGGQVVRLYGQDRYDTAAAVAQRFRPAARTVYLTTGLNFPDAISGGAAAAREDAPMVMSGQGALEPATRTFLQSAKPTKVVVLGGTLALPAAVVNEVTSLVPGVQVVRYSGVDQYDTAAQVTRAVFAGVSRPALGYATGANFPDALSGTPLMVKLGGGMLLTTATCHPGVTLDATTALNPSARYVLGGTLVAYAGEARC